MKTYTKWPGIKKPIKQSKKNQHKDLLTDHHDLQNRGKHSQEKNLVVTFISHLFCQYFGRNLRQDTENYIIKVRKSGSDNNNFRFYLVTCLWWW